MTNFKKLLVEANTELIGNFPEIIELISNKNIEEANKNIKSLRRQTINKNVKNSLDHALEETNPIQKAAFVGYAHACFALGGYK